MRFILPSLALVGTVLATLTGLVLCMAMGANAKPPEIRILKFWMAAIVLLGLTGVGVGVLLMRAGKPGWAALAAFAPTVLLGITLLVALLR